MPKFLKSVCELEIAPFGQGIMGWKEFLPVIVKKEPDAYLIFEGVKNVPDSLAFVRSIVG